MDGGGRRREGSEAMQATQTVRAHPFWLAWANRPARAIAWTFFVACAVVAASIALAGAGAPGWRAAARHTAQLALPLYLVAFLASSIVRLWPGARTRALLARRRALGLAFATAHFVHGGTIFVLARFDDTVFAPRTALYLGAFGFVLVAAMAATSNDAAQRWLGGRAWRGLHRTGQLYLFAIFLSTYAGRIGRGQSGDWVGIAVLVAAAGIRLAAATRSRSLRNRTAPIE
jgi:sulfoxide reductase heme-binding subunit YedZ